MKKELSTLISSLLIITSFTSCDTNEVVDQTANIVQYTEEHVQSVKNGTNSAYPDKTWGEAFDGYFGYPTWKYFKGVLEGPDEDEDGEPDYTQDNVDIVEFTGYCMYRDTKVKARIQFQLHEDDTFEATYLAFNEVPQNQLLLNLIISNAFEDDKATWENQTTEEYSEAEDFEVEETITESHNIPEETSAVENSTIENKQTQNQNSNSSSSLNPVSVGETGQIFSHGGTIYGVTTNYACNENASYETQWPVEDTWHITIKNTVSSHGVSWYECWDSDDGDYYGWIDGTYIRLYTDSIYKSGNVERVQYFDLNYDGKSEVFVKSGTCEADYMYYVYSPKSNDIYEYVGCLPGNFSVLCTQNGVLYRNKAVQGNQEIYEISMFDYDISESCIYSGYAEPGEDYKYAGEYLD